MEGDYSRFTPSGRIAEICGDELDGLQVEHVGHLPGSLGGVALDGVNKGIHAGGGGTVSGTDGL